VTWGASSHAILAALSDLGAPDSKYSLGTDGLIGIDVSAGLTGEVNISNNTLTSDGEALSAGITVGWVREGFGNFLPDIFNVTGNVLSGWTYEFVLDGLAPIELDHETFNFTNIETYVLVQEDEAGNEPILLPFVLGTAAAETITLPKSETGIGFTVALRGGNDEISLSEGSIDVVIFSADPADNGFDTITNFKTGTAEDGADVFMISGLSLSDLRGSGTEFGSLAANNSIGADTGLTVFTTAIAISKDATEADVNAVMAEAAKSLQGLDVGDVFYMLAGTASGTDENAALARISVGAEDEVTAEALAKFIGFDMANLNPHQFGLDLQAPLVEV